MNVHIIIPARLGSTRLKNKMLKKILGKTLIEHMCERALKLNFKNLVVATDSKEIIETVAKYNINTYFSSKKFNNGTERIRDYLIKKNIYFGIANITFPYRRFVPVKLVYSVLFFYYHEKLQLKLLLS